MKIVFVTNIYKEEEKEEIKRVSEEIKGLGFDNYRIYVNDGIKDNRGYAYGINQGIQKGLKDKADVFVVFNADISLKKLNKKIILDGLKYFDVLGFAVKQDNTAYYGGEIDRWRMSGGMIRKKPKERYVMADFISGSLMFIKRQVIEKTGLFDESYFFYYDETDYCYRVKKHGFNIGIDSKNHYIHYEFSKTNTRKEYFLAKNRLKFFLKYSSFRQKIYEFLRSPKTFIEYIPLFKSIVVNSKFLTNFFSLNLSSLLNKLFHFGLFIILVRTLPPEKYGIYTLVWAYIAIFSPLLDLGTTSYGLVYLPKEKKSMMSKLISMRFFIAGLIFLFVNITAFFTFSKQPEIFRYTFFTSVVILSNVWSGTYLIINSIKERIINSSLISLAFNILFVITIIIGLLIKPDLFIIFFTVFLLYVVYTLINFLLVKKEIPDLKLLIDFSVWKKILSRSYIFVLIGFFAEFYYKQDIFLLKFMKSENAVGIYSSGYKFLDALLLLAASYNITVLPIFSRLTKELHLLKKKIFKDFLMLLVIGATISIMFYLLAPLLLPLVLKKSYVGGIVVSRIVVFSLPFILLSSIFYNVLYAFDSAKTVVFILGVQIIINLILNIVFIPRYSFYASAYITVTSEIINLGLAYYFVRRKLAKL